MPESSGAKGSKTSAKQAARSQSRLPAEGEFHVFLVWWRLVRPSVCSADHRSEFAKHILVDEAIKWTALEERL
jgi:hypothetical protein